MHVIYKITNIINEKCYIGQCANVKNRWRSHIRHANLASDGYLLKNNRIQVIHLAMAKYGINNFSFEILEVVKNQELANLAEDSYIEKFKAIKNGYNCKPGGLVSGHTAETREKISNSLKGRTLSLEHKKNISKSCKGIEKKRTKPFVGKKSTSPLFDKIVIQDWKKTSYLKENWLLNIRLPEG